MDKKYDALVIGAGPAGISAAIYMKRAGIEPAVVHMGGSQLDKAHRIDNYYGFPDGISGPELYAAGVLQAENLGIDVISAEVLGSEMTPEMTFSTKFKEAGGESNCVETAAVIIATGNKKVRPDIEGIAGYEGKGVSYCAICDGFFYRGRTVGVIGDGDYVMSEASDLENIAAGITILTNGRSTEKVRASIDKKEEALRAKYRVIDKKIIKVTGDDLIDGVIFEDGESLKLDGLFVAEGTAGGGNFARKMGIVLEGDNIKTDEDMKTNIPGIFACGNLTGGLLQVNKAAYEGAKAGLSAAAYIKEQRRSRSV